MSEAAIWTAGLRKEYGATVAVEGLDLAVSRGEVFGFLGPNGAGKTTSLKMMLGLVHPTSGEAKVLGRPVGEWEPRRRVGFLPEHFRFQEWLRAGEFLQIHGRLYDMQPAELRTRVPELLELVGLARQAEKPLRDFSKGMLQRIGLAQALLPHPDLIFLDEPTSGLDPIGRRLVRDIITSLRRDGVAVFLNSHLLGEIEVTCDRVAFIRKGSVVQIGRLDELLNAHTEVELRLGPVEMLPLLGRELAQFGPCEAGADGRLLLRLQNDEVIADVVAWLTSQGARVYGVEARRSTLEELFMQVMEGEEAG